MNNMQTKFLLPLAALALVSAACDPFPAKPGGDPAIVRVTTHGPSGDSNTVETVTGGNTVSTNYAWIDSRIRVQFNKPMDGTSIQKYTNFDTSVPIDPATIGINNNPGFPAVVPPVPPHTDTGRPYSPCTPATTLTLTNFPPTVPGIPAQWNPTNGRQVAGTGIDPVYNLVCYDPTSPTDGGQLVVYPAADLVYGTTYTIAGTVKDYEGKSITINVTVTVDQRPLPFALGRDGYSAGIDWFDSGATSYEVFRAPDVSGVAGVYASVAVIDPAVYCGGGWCGLHYDTMLVPNTTYWYQVRQTIGGVTTTRPAATGPISTVSPLLPSFGVTTTATVPPVLVPGVLRVAWSPVAGATGYDVERAPDNVGVPGLFASIVIDTASPYIDGTVTPLTTGATYWYRVTPVYPAPPAGYVPVKGRSASKVAP